MLVLLPPSETKRHGGVPGSTLRVRELAFPSLLPSRRVAIAATRALSRNKAASAIALRLGATQEFEILRNRTLTTSPVMEALDRYTGVLYDALDAPSLTPAARARAATSVVVHSALFGLLRADDAIPAYRLSHDSRLPGLRLGTLWRAAVTACLDAHPGLILDLRSEGYVALGPVPTNPNAFFLRVVTEQPDGTKRALNHFNKRGKGEFVRALLDGGGTHDDVAGLLDWARSAGLRLHRGAPGELELVVDGVVGVK